MDLSTFYIFYIWITVWNINFGTWRWEFEVGQENRIEPNQAARTQQGKS